MVDNEELVEQQAEGMAKLNITYSGQQGDLPDPVSYDMSDAEIKQIATETVRNGDIPGIDADADASFTDFVVDRFPAREDVPFNRLSLRPKTPFGANNYCDFSEAISNITEEEKQWLTEILALEEPEEILKKAGIGDYESASENLDFWPGFSHAFQADRDGKIFLWVYSDGGDGIELVEFLMKAFLTKFRPTEVFTLTWAETCSKPRLSEFGGGGFAVSKDDTRWFNVHRVVEEAAREMSGEGKL